MAATATIEQEHLPEQLDVELIQNWLDQQEAEPASERLSVVQGSIDQEADVAQSVVLVDVDTIPELYTRRLSAGREAIRILAANRQLLNDGDFDSVPIPVDALGTARLVVEVKEKLGVDSPEYKELFEGLVLDCERLYAEASRKNVFEYFLPTTQELEAETLQYFANGIPTLDTVERGLSPITKPEQLERRINDFTHEHVNHEIPRVLALGRLGLRRTVNVLHISECTDESIKAYKVDPKGSHGGEAPAIEKLMVGGMRFTELGPRYQEQVALSGINITREVIMAVLQDLGAIAEGQTLAKTELHGKQFIDQTGAGVINFARLLDQKASQLSGNNIFMGEVVPEGHKKDYSRVAQEAEERQLRLAPKPVQLAEYLIDLQEKGTDRFAAEGLVADHLKVMLLEVAQKNPELAAMMFDEETAQGFREVMRLESLGQREAAWLLQEKIKENAPAVSYCGAGSCGLESIMEKLPPAARQELLKQLKAEPGDKIVKDTERACTDCGEKTVVYAYNDKKVNKLCTNCGKFESKKTK